MSGRWLGLGIWLAGIMAVAAQEPLRPLTEPAAPVCRAVEIRFVGPETVNRAVVVANTQIKVGQPVTQMAIEQDVRTLIKTGFFSDVRVLQEAATDGVKVIYQVQGKATIKEVVVTGNKYFKEPRLRRDIQLKVGGIYDELKAFEDKQKLTVAYEKAGYYDANVTVEARIDKDTGKAIVRYQISEGQRLFLRQVQINGTKAIKTKALLKLLKTKAKWWGSWMSGTGVIKQEQLQEDLDRIREYYRSRGYLDMAITANKVERIKVSGQPSLRLVIDLYEGPQYKVAAVRITGNKLFPTVELERKLKMIAGQTFTPTGMQADMKALADFYGSRGYLDTDVQVTRKPSPQSGRIDLAYAIKEGELTYIELIQIRGNTKTKDKVIRRELAVFPGQKFNTVLVEKSEQRLKNLNYFSKVDAVPGPTAVPNRKNLVITVEEQRTGNMVFGAGFSSIDSLSGFVEVSQSNFDLFNWPNFTGGGQRLMLRLQLGLERQDYTLSFTEPWFLDKKLLLGVELYHREASYYSDYYRQGNTGGTLRLEKPLAEFVRGEVSYSIQNIEIDPDSNASAAIDSQRGFWVRSGVQLGLTYDSRNNVFLTTRGNRTELSAEATGGPLGGQVDLYKLNARTTFYFPSFNGQVFQLIGGTGVVSAYGAMVDNHLYVVEPSDLSVVKVDDVPIFDRFYLGGANNLRGFGYRKVGPKDVNKEPIGGNTYVLGTAEYTFPVVDRIRFAIFFDIGDVWQDTYEYSLGDLKSDIGIGLRLNLPVGPIRLDYGYPVQSDKQSGESGHFQFSAGYQF